MSGYESLTAEVREIVGRIAVSYEDEQLAAWAQSGPIEIDAARVFSSPSMPVDRLPSPAPDSTVNLWVPDRSVVVELALRTASARAKRWIVDEQRLVPMPQNWRDVFRSTAGERFGCEISIGPGWVDLMLSVDEWVIEIGESARWGQIKEKYGSLRIYPHNSLDDRAIDFIDHAENVLSKRICETCGSPGRTRDRAGWYYTSCDEHEK